MEVSRCYIRPSPAPSRDQHLPQSDGRHRLHLRGVRHTGRQAGLAWILSLLTWLSPLVTWEYPAQPRHYRKFAAEDVQNATLSGGVIVGATADMILQPAGAVTAGSLAGLVSTLGYKILGGKLFQRLGIHDTCGVNNLHGMPGILAGLLSVVMVVLASEETYGPELTQIFPRLAPPHGRTLSDQALIQLAALAITLLLSILLGLSLSPSLPAISITLYDLCLPRSPGRRPHQSDPAL